MSVSERIAIIERWRKIIGNEKGELYLRAMKILGDIEEAVFKMNDDDFCTALNYLQDWIGSRF